MQLQPQAESPSVNVSLAKKGNCHVSFRLTKIHPGPRNGDPFLQVTWRRIRSLNKGRQERSDAKKANNSSQHGTFLFASFPNFGKVLKIALIQWKIDLNKKAKQFPFSNNQVITSEIISTVLQIKRENVVWICKLSLITPIYITKIKYFGVF